LIVIPVIGGTLGIMFNLDQHAPLLGQVMEMRR
jgi:hypothetical protein